MNNQTTQLFTEKAEKYLVCYYAECAKADRCLRRMLADYVPPTRRVVESVNAGYVKAHKGKCEYFRSAELITMYKGMKAFYNEIPEQKAKLIRYALTRHFGNSSYYRLRNGERLITPDVLRYIQNVCTTNDWNEPLHFDEEVAAYNW